LREIQPEKPKAQKKVSFEKLTTARKSGFSDVSNTPFASMGTIYKKISSSTFLS
jgi:hypothetical protein